MGGGGFLDSSRPGVALVALLKAHATDYTWVAATVDANNAAGYQLSTGDPVMAIGGFNGTDPVPSLAQFQTYVRDGKVHYFIAGGRGLGGGRQGYYDGCGDCRKYTHHGCWLASRPVLSACLTMFCFNCSILN